MALTGCSQPVVTFLPQPIAVTLSEPGGALIAWATVDDLPARFPVVVDTGTPLTAYDDHQGATGAHIGNFHLFGDAPGGLVRRLELDGIELYSTPLGSVGLTAPFTIGGVFGGDNLERFAVAFDYRSTPSLSFSETVALCGCELALDGQAVFPFTLLGGQQTLAIGTNLYTYPATRVILDACLEPQPDPLREDLPCATNEACNPPASNARYQPSGVEVKVLVASGFPGLAIGASAFDRLRGAGAAAQALANPTLLHLPDSAQPISVGTAVLGRAGASALALVSRELFLGPCGELARSRRQRRSPHSMPRPGEAACLESTMQPCHPPNAPAPLPCGDRPNLPNACDDNSDFAHTAAIVELTAPLPLFVVDDAAALLQSVNADVTTPQPNPASPPAAAVELVAGTALLARLVATIDYPHQRFLARCAGTSDCIAYPRFVVPSQQGDCEDASLCAQVDLTRPCPPAP